MPANESVESALSHIKNDKLRILTLTLGMHKVTPGQEILRADAQAAPGIAFDLTANTTYMVIGLDIDAPFPSFGVLGPILHWIQPRLKAKRPADGTAMTASDAQFVANYIGPAPLAGSAAHRYIFLLYEQPADFDGKRYAPAGGKNLGNWNRMRYPLGAFEKEARLGPVLAANYFSSK